MEENLQLFPNLARALKYKVQVDEHLFLRQSASGINLFHLPTSYRYPTGNIPGYFISLNWNDQWIILEKERKERNEYFLIDRNHQIVYGPFDWEEYQHTKQAFGIHMELLPTSELDWIINF